MADWSQLSDELRKLGVKFGKEQPIQPSPKKKSASIENLLPGREIETIFGKVFSVPHTYPLDYQHGSVPIFPLARPTVLAEWARASTATEADLSSLVFLDTETTGLSGGTGTMAFMIGAARFVDNSFVVEQFFLRNPSEEKAQLAALTRFVDGASALVTYNGKSFDLPILNTRYVLNRLSNPFSDVDHYDLLHIVRRIWRRRLKECNLGVIEKEIMNFFRTSEDIPGYLVPEFYRDYLLHGDGSQIAGIFYHNEIDVVSLAALFNLLAEILENPLTTTRIPDPQDRLSLGKLMEFMRYGETAEEILMDDAMRMLDSDEQIIALNSRAGFHKRRNDYESALPLWEEALSLGSTHAGIELAMFYEHSCKRYEEAIFYTQKCIEIVSYREESPIQKKQLAQLDHRLNRLSNKSKNSPEKNVSV